MIAIVSGWRSLLGEVAVHRQELRPGEFLFRQNDPVIDVHLVTRGEVRLIRHQPQGGTLILQRVRAGSVLAEVSVFSTEYHCDSAATLASEVERVPVSTLRQKLADSDFAQVWAARLSREIQSTRVRAEILALRTVAERLTAWIDWHGSLPAKGDWSALALEIGVSPEALYRELAKRKGNNQRRERSGTAPRDSTD